MKKIYFIILICLIVIGVVIIIATRRKESFKKPNVLIIGTQKGGTTNLKYLLGKHPDIFMYPHEIHYFNKNKLTEREYLKLFKTNKKIVGEKTPNYNINKKAMKKIYKFNPKVKLILLLRNPITRAYSAWNHFKQHCPYDERSFRECIIDDLHNKKTRCQNKSITMTTNGLIRYGRYIEHINDILSLFPKDQLYIGITERFKKNTKYELDKILKFLGANCDHKLNLESHVHSRSYDQKMSQEDYDFLYKLYKPYNDRLFKHLGYRIPEWEN